MTVRSVSCAVLVLVVGGCVGEELPTIPAGGPEATGEHARLALVDDGEFAALTYNVHGVPDEIPTGLAGFIAEYNAAVARMVAIGPLLNGYELAVIQEDFVMRIEIDLWLFTLRITVDGLYDALDEAALHAYRSGHQSPLPPPVQPPTSLHVAFSDGLVRFSELAMNPGALEREAWARCNGSDCYAHKGFSMVRTTLPSSEGVIVDIYNLHMDAGSEMADLQVRWDQAIQLAEAINTRSAGNAVIVAGDTNLDLYSEDPIEAGRDREILEELLDRAGLSDACTELLCCNPDPGSANPCDGRQIDRFLYRSSEGEGRHAVQLEPLSWTAHDDGSEFEGLSDHSAIEVLFAWRVYERTVSE